MLMGGLTGIDLVDHSGYEPPVGRTSLTRFIIINQQEVGRTCQLAWMLCCRAGLVKVIVMTWHCTKQTSAALKKNILPGGVICIKAINISMMTMGRLWWSVTWKWNGLLLSVKGQVVQQQTYFNFFTTLSDLGPWLDFTLRREPSSHSDRAVSS